MDKREEQQKEWIIEQLKKEIQNGDLNLSPKFTRKYERREKGMNFEVVNRDICVGSINVLGVSSSSVINGWGCQFHSAYFSL